MVNQYRPLSSATSEVSSLQTDDYLFCFSRLQRWKARAADPMAILQLRPVATGRNWNLEPLTYRRQPAA